MQEIAKLVMEKDLLTPSSERKGDIEELQPEALKDLVGRLSKLSTEERVGSPYDNEHASTSTVAAAQQAPERLPNAADLGASELELEMKEIGEDDVNVILELSRVHSATQSGTSREPKGGGRAHRRTRGGTFVCSLTPSKTFLVRQLSPESFIMLPLLHNAKFNEVQYQAAHHLSSGMTILGLVY